jgi:hypothetical protein
VRLARGELQPPGLADQNGEDEDPAVISKLIDTVENDKEPIAVREDSTTNLRQTAQGRPEGELLDNTVKGEPNITVRLEVDVNTVERRDPGPNWDEDSASRPIGVVHETGPEEPPRLEEQQHSERETGSDSDDDSHDTAYAEALREEDEYDEHEAARERGALYIEAMQTAHQCIAALEEGRKVTSFEVTDAALEVNPGLEHKVGDDEMFLLFARAIENVMLEYIQLGGLESVARHPEDRLSAKSPGSSQGEEGRLISTKQSPCKERLQTVCFAAAAV